MNTNENVQTSVDSMNMSDIDSWLGAPGSESVIIQNEPAEQPGFLKQNTEDLDFGLPGSEKEEVKKDVPHGTENINTEEVLNELSNDIHAEPEAEVKTGRPKTDKSGLVNTLKKRIESGEFFAFDDYDEENQTLEDYLGALPEKDIDELITANINHIRQTVAEQTPKEFFEALPEEFQYAVEYLTKGGMNMKEIFRALAQVQEVKELDPSNEHDQEQIVRQYLLATQFGDESEINEEIDNWKDLGQLENKANKFKPKLDKMQEEVVQAQIAQQEQLRQQQEQAALNYRNSVYEALKPGELKGIKLDKKTQADLYNGLTTAQYPSISGNSKTNELGYLLEKYQFVEPDMGLIAEVLYLMRDREAYHKSLVQKGKNESTEATARQLKTEQSSKKTGSYQQEESKKTSQKIARNRPQNFFGNK